MALHIPGYQIIRKINQGGMSTVYLAIQISVGRVVALKVMSPGLTTDPAFNERFQREATIVGQLSHPNIVSIYDIGRQGNLNYIAMDYLPGGSVHDRMLNGLTSEEALRITKEIASALDHAHEKGYIHRDIKPENILFRADNSAVLSDFGVAKGIVGTSRMTYVGTVVGTPHYMSPEQARGQAVDSRSDLYSLGVVFYEMLTGSLPYQGEDAVAIALKHIGTPVPKLPLHFQLYQKILDKLLAKNPEERFQKGSDICTAIDQLDANVRSSTTPNTTSADLSIMDLIRALLVATSYSAKWHWERFKKLRWSKAQGFYHNPPSPTYDFDIKASPTIFNTRIEHAHYIKHLINPRRYRIVKRVVLFVVAFIVWCGISLLMHSSYSHQIKAVSQFFYEGMHQTAELFGAEKYTEDDTPPTSNTSPTNSTSNTASIEILTNHQTNSSTSSVASSFAVVETVVYESSSESSESAKPIYALTIKVVPEKAQIRLLNVSTKYKEGIELNSGRYHIEISKPGYETKTEWIEIKNQPIMLMAQLEKKPEETTTTNVPTPVFNKNIPTMIRVAAGNFIMGDNNYKNTSPAHKVIIEKAFAISKYEITFNEFDTFAEETNHALPGDNGWGRDKHPVINISWDDANAYVEWLSRVTGKKYRLPTEAEWEYVARAGTKTRYWWGDSELDAKGNANCRRGCNSSYSGLFVSKTAPVGSYPANAFGVFDTAGNVAEWVEDCYQENYTSAANNGAPHDEKQCAGHVVRGGSLKDNVQRLMSASRDDIPKGFLNETIGFRIVMDLN